MSKKGRKVYRTNSYEKKKRLKKAFNALLGIIVIGGLVFLGYSVGKPIINYLNKENSSLDNVEEPWTPPVITDVSGTDNSIQPNDNAATSDQAYVSETTDEVKDTSTGITTFMLPEDALSNPSQFIAVINKAKADGYTAVSVTLKAKGGKVYFNTTSPMLKLDENAIVSNMPIQQIAYMMKDSGLKAIAEINILEDNNRYGEYRDGSYHMLDGSTWLDTAANKGGKPWLSPFEEDTKEMVRYVTDEIAAAGFDYITLSGLSFPPFRNSDLNLIGDNVKNPNRYTALIELSQIAQNAANEHNTGLYVRLNAAEVIYGKSELFKPSELKGYTLVLDFDPAEFSESVIYKNNEVVLRELDPGVKFKTVFEIIKTQCGDEITLIPIISESGLSHADFDSLISEIVNEGFESYFVK